MHSYVDKNFIPVKSRCYTVTGRAKRWLTDSTFTELQDMKQALAESPPPLGPGHAQGQDPEDVNSDGGLAQQNYSVVRGDAFQGCSHGQ
jgi:hypothetical protein